MGAVTFTFRFPLHVAAADFVMLRAMPTFLGILLTDKGLGPLGSFVVLGQPSF
jgi:hypothetical protein